MSRTIFCQKLKKELEGLEVPPYPGPIGQKIYTSISKEAWKAWLGRQTMFINEYRLNLLEVEARHLLEQEMQRFLFEGLENTPPGYTGI